MEGLGNQEPGRLEDGSGTFFDASSLGLGFRILRVFRV